MKKVLIQNSEQLELVKEEIRVSSLFTHPNLLPLLDHAIISVKVDILNSKLARVRWCLATALGRDVSYKNINQIHICPRHSLES